MKHQKIRLSHAYGEVAPNTFADFAWARENEPRLLADYGVGVALVYEQQVVGFGKTLDEAHANAEAKRRDIEGQITPVIVLLHERQPFFRVYPEPTTEDV